MKQNIYLLLALFTISLASCSDDEVTTTYIPSGGTSVVQDGSLSVEFDESSLSETDDVYTDETADPDLYDDYVENSETFKNVVTITYSESSVSYESTDEDGDVVVSIDGTDVTVNAAKKAKYILQGSCSDGSFKVYSEKKFQVQLAGLTLTNPTGAAINSQSKKRMFLCVADGTENTLQDGTSYTTKYNSDSEEEDEKGVIFSEGQIILSGSGKLNINAVGKNGLASDQYLRIRPTTRLTVVASATASNAVKADSIVIMGGVLNLSTASADGKGLQCSESNVIISGGRTTIITTGEGDSSSGGGMTPGGTIPGGGGFGPHRAASSSTGNAPKGIKAIGYIEVTGGTLKVRCDGASGECIESKYSDSEHAAIHVSGGSVLAYAKQDDAVNASGIIKVTGGSLCAYSTGNDAIDSNYGRNGAITVTGGTIAGISTAGSPEEGIDCDNTSYIVITGGKLICLGGSQNGANRLSSSCTQGYYIGSGQTFSEGITYTLYDSNQSYTTFTSPFSVYSQLTILSAPGMSVGGSFSVQ